MTPAIKIQDVDKYYDSKNGQPFHALNKISFDVAQGDFFALLGPNGAGKTTLINAMAGLNKINGGVIEIMGFDIHQQTIQAKKALGIVPQELVFDPFFTVQESLQFQSGYYGIKNNSSWIKEILENLGLSDKANTNMRKLSGGMKRRVMVAQALVHKPQVIVLDEPTAGVDVELRQNLWQFIARLNQAGHTILLTTHYLEEAQTLCNKIALMQKGALVTLKSTQELLQDFSGLKVKLKLQHANFNPVTQQDLPIVLQSLYKRHVGQYLLLDLQDYGALEGILNQLKQAQFTIEEMQLEQADLEDVFLALTKG